MLVELNVVRTIVELSSKSLPRIKYLKTDIDSASKYSEVVRSYVLK